MKTVLLFSILLYGIVISSICYASSCEPLLWPHAAFTPARINSIPQTDMQMLKKQARKSMARVPAAIVKLSSAGKINLNDSILKRSRLALREADSAASLALAYKVTHDEMYLDATKNILIKWATTNVPTGHPIDETRLQGLIWAYDLIACHLATYDKTIIKSWFEGLRQKKLAWQFGAITKTNNHRIHQLKMLLLLDRVLQRVNDWQTDLTNVQQYSTINLNPESGVSLDYLHRSSLYYHNYDVEAWLEINLLANQSIHSVDKAFNFLITQIRHHNIHNEFTYSQAKIDGLRAKGGFAYAKTGSSFDVRRAVPNIITYYSMRCDDISSDLLAIINKAKPSPWLSFIKVRKALWKNCQERQNEI